MSHQTRLKLEDKRREENTKEAALLSFPKKKLCKQQTWRLDGFYVALIKCDSSSQNIRPSCLLGPSSLDPRTLHKSAAEERAKQVNVKSAPFAPLSPSFNHLIPEWACCEPCCFASERRPAADPSQEGAGE